MMSLSRIFQGQVWVIGLTHHHWLKKMRLRRSDDFQTVWSSGQSWTHTFFVVWAMPNDLPHSRIGIVASRKVGKAIDRNRARRLLREATRHIYANIESGWDIVLVARSKLLSVKTPEVVSALRDILHHAGLYLNNGINK